jgi:PAS domain S-box-containing protein
MSLKNAISKAQSKAAQLPDSVISVYDEAGIIRFITPNVEKYTGYSAEQSMGVHYEAFTPKREMATTVLAREDTILNGESVEVTIDAVHMDGNTYPWKVIGWRVSGDGHYVVLAARRVG